MVEDGLPTKRIWPHIGVAKRLLTINNGPELDSTKQLTK